MLGSTSDQSKTKFAFDNIAYVGYFPTGNYDGIKGWNFGFGYNRVKNFARNYQTKSSPVSSLSDYMAALTNDLAKNNSNYSGENLWLTDNYNPFNSGLNHLSVAGYSGLIGSDSYTVAGDSLILSADFPDGIDRGERGAIDQYDFALATNISDMVFLGASLC